MMRTLEACFSGFFRECGQKQRVSPIAVAEWRTNRYAWLGRERLRLNRTERIFGVDTKLTELVLSDFATPKNFPRCRQCSRWRGARCARRFIANHRWSKVPAKRTRGCFSKLATKPPSSRPTPTPGSRLTLDLFTLGLGIIVFILVISRGGLTAAEFFPLVQSFPWKLFLPQSEQRPCCPLQTRPCSRMQAEGRERRTPIP